MATYFRLDPIDAQKFIAHLLERFRGNDCRASFEGQLQELSLSTMNLASSLETEQIHRHTIWPKQDFCIVPVTQDSVSKLIEIVENPIAFLPDCIVHFQIEIGGQLLFGSYDNLDKSCFFAYPPITSKDLESMVQLGLLNGYSENRDGAT